MTLAKLFRSRVVGHATSSEHNSDSKPSRTLLVLPRQHARKGARLQPVPREKISEDRATRARGTFTGLAFGLFKIP